MAEIGLRPLAAPTARTAAGWPTWRKPALTTNSKRSATP
jgi:hypothetical protein